MSVRFRRNICSLLPTYNSNWGLLNYVFSCRYTSAWRWKMFTLDDELTLDVKQSIEKKWMDKVYGVSCVAERNKVSLTPMGHKYILSMFPYPSGRLHLGHVRVYTLGDVLARFYRMKGHTVVHPMGWDAFGLPAENAARDSGVDAEKWTRENIKSMKDQIIKMGCCFDWEREFATCDHSYYRWNQWLFIQLFKKGMVYRKKAYVFWDPIDKTVLAEEQVDSEMRSWRSGAKVERKLFRQWFILTAAFAKDLTGGLESSELKTGWRDIVSLQKHWIGTIKGHFTDCVVEMKNIDQRDKNSFTEKLRLWFSNEEQLAKAKFCIIRKDHYLAESNKYVEKEFENGIQLMNFVIVNPATGVKMPCFSGQQEIIPCVPESTDCRVDEFLNEAEFPELCKNDNCIQEINNICVELHGINRPALVPSLKFDYYPASLKLRDWLVSRQRKWGTPIPAMNCNSCGHSEIVPFEELQESRAIQDRKSQCPKCGSNMDPETDTLDTFFDSSWYFFRYLDNNNNSAIFDTNKIKPYLPVDVYVGGKEHATLHLYYARFMSHFLHKMGLVEDKEPFRKLIPVGVVMGETYIGEKSGKYWRKEEIGQVAEGETLCATQNNEPVLKKWEKMSKSKHNGVDPEEVINEYSIDTTRLLMMGEIVPTSTRQWPSQSMWGFIKWQTRMWSTLRDFSLAKDFGEPLIATDEDWKIVEDRNYDARNFYLKGVTHCFDKTSQISVGISKLQGMMADIRKTPKEYMKESLQFERALGTLIICMYPIMPAFGAQLWQEFRVVADLTYADFNLDKEVWEQNWPEVDMDYKLDLFCKMGAKEVAVIKVERQILDTLDVNIASELALEEPTVAKLLPRESSTVLSFSVEPGYGAVISFRKPKKVPSASKTDLKEPIENNLTS